MKEITQNERQNLEKIIGETLQKIRKSVVSAYDQLKLTHDDIDTGKFIQSFLVNISVDLQNSFIDPESNLEDVAHGIKSLMEIVSQQVNEIWALSLHKKKMNCN